jgi:TonB-linked SusC/RagA family outer membrane protein
MIGRQSLKCLMAFFLLLNCTYLIAQERVVTGKIKDPSGNPLPGVNVNVWGTRISVTADVTGTFRIPVASENSVLVFTFVGFLQKEVKVGNETDLNVSMTYDNADLDQVVVVGYGTSKRRDLTGSVYTVKPGMVTATPTFNAGEALQGRIPGLDINRSGGNAGAGVTIQLRGNRTLSGTTNGVTGSNSAPLVVIDGFQGGSLSDLNPNDIESVEVLKDASATAIYGWMGANGVIIVTTKRGKDRPKVSYSGFYGVNGIPQYPKLRMRDEYTAFRREAYRAANNEKLPDNDELLYDAGIELDAYKADKWVDWYDVINRTGKQQSHSVSIQSGGDKTKVFLSGGYYREEGILRGNDFTRYNTRLNFDQRISNSFKAGLYTQLTWTNTNNRKDPMSQVNGMTPLGDVYTDAGLIKLFPLEKANTKVSPLTDERPGAFKDNKIGGNVTTNAYIEFAPITGLTFKSSFGATLGWSRRGYFKDSLTLDQFGKPNGNLAQIENGLNRFYNWDNVITYNKKIAEHNITLTAISSITRSDDETSSLTGRRQPLASYEFFNLGVTEANSRITGSGYTKTTTTSYAGRLNYTFKGKYLLTASLRADGVSRLAEGNKWDYFPSVGLGWNIHQEDFMRDAWFVNNLKLRATYGVAGNASVQAYGTQSVVFFQGTTIGNVVVPTSFYLPNDNKFSLLPNKELSWEKTGTVNLGLDFALFKSRIFGSIDAYKSKTTDILYLRPQPQSTGFSYTWENIGESENKGIELSLSSVNMNSRDFKWTTTLTYTATQEKLTKLTDGKNIIKDETNALIIGKPISAIYSFEKLGIWQTEEKKLASRYKAGGGSYTFVPGDIKVADLNGDSSIDATNDRQYLGAQVPKWFAGLQNTFTYKGFELGIYVIARFGQTINAEFMGSRYNVNGTGNGIESFNYWTPENPTNDFPRPRANVSNVSAYGGYTGYTSLNFIDGSFIKLKTVTLAYTLPGQIAKKVFSEKIRLYATGNNIWTKAKSHFLKDYDPERGGFETTPLTRQIVFGANVDF